jgi:hypothetical protein
LPDGSLENYRDVIQRTFGAKYTLDDVYAGDLFSALGAIESGVTCMKRGGQTVGLDFARLQRLGDEARDRVYSTAKVKNSRV